MPPKTVKKKQRPWWEEPDDFYDAENDDEFLTQKELVKLQKDEIALRKGAVRIRKTGALPREVVSYLEGLQTQQQRRKVREFGTSYAGYDNLTFAMDVNGSFLHKGFGPKTQESMRDLHDLAEKGFARNTLFGYEPSTNAPLPSHARKAAVKHYKFVRKFPRTALYQMLLQGCGMDADKATLAFFEACGGKPNIDDLQELADKDLKELREIGMGHQWGRGQGGLKRWLNIKKLMRYIQKDWDFAGERTKRRRQVMYPADDVTFRPMRGLGEIVNATMSAFGDTTLLGYKIAARQIMVKEYEEIIPGPPKNFAILIDGSGSMSSNIEVDVGGERFDAATWAVAIAMAITQAADGTDNKVWIGMFSDGITSSFRGGNAREAEKWLWKQGFSGGGTDIHGALKWADGIHENVHPLEATIIITDGQGTNPQKPLSPLYTVFTEGNRRSTSYRNSAKSLFEFAEKVIFLPETKVKEQKYV